MERKWVVICVIGVVSLVLESYSSNAKPAKDGETDSFAAWWAKRTAENWTGNGESKTIEVVLKQSQGPQTESGEVVAILTPNSNKSTIKKVHRDGTEEEMGVIDTVSLNAAKGGEVESGPKGRFLLDFDLSIFDFSKNKKAKKVNVPPKGGPGRGGQAPPAYGQPDYGGGHGQPDYGGGHGHPGYGGGHGQPGGHRPPSNDDEYEDEDDEYEDDR